MWPASILASKTWPRPPGSGLDLGLGFDVLTSFNIIGKQLLHCGGSMHDCYLALPLLARLMDVVNAYG